MRSPALVLRGFNDKVEAVTDCARKAGWTGWPGCPPARDEESDTAGYREGAGDALRRVGRAENASVEHPQRSPAAKPSSNRQKLNAAPRHPSTARSTAGLAAVHRKPSPRRSRPLRTEHLARHSQGPAVASGPPAAPRSKRPGYVEFPKCKYHADHEEWSSIALKTRRNSARAGKMFRCEVEMALSGEQLAGGSACRSQSHQFHFGLGTAIDTSKAQDRFPEASFGLFGVPM